MRAERKPEKVGPRVESYQLREQSLKRCSTCKQVKSFPEFNIRNSEKGWLKNHCKNCESDYNRAHHLANREDRCRNAREYYKEWKPKRWQLVLENLGDSCKCCGESDRKFLTVDHINSDGWKEKTYETSNGRAGRALWGKVIREGYPKDRYQILCYNCNCGRDKSEGKICPHNSADLNSLIGACG